MESAVHYVAILLLISGWTSCRQLHIWHPFQVLIFMHSLVMDVDAWWFITPVHSTPGSFVQVVQTWVGFQYMWVNVIIRIPDTYTRPDYTSSTKWFGDHYHTTDRSIIDHVPFFTLRHHLSSASVITRYTRTYMYMYVCKMWRHARDMRIHRTIYTCFISTYG